MAVLYVMPPQGICCMYSGVMEGGHKRHWTDVAKGEGRRQVGLGHYPDSEIIAANSATSQERVDSTCIRLLKHGNYTNDGCVSQE